MSLIVGFCVSGTRSLNCGQPSHSLLKYLIEPMTIATTAIRNQFSRRQSETIQGAGRDQLGLRGVVGGFVKDVNRAWKGVDLLVPKILITRVFDGCVGGGSSTSSSGSHGMDIFAISTRGAYELAASPTLGTFLIARTKEKGGERLCGNRNAKEKKNGEELLGNLQNYP